MNVVMLSPHFPSNFSKFSHRLNLLGITVLGIDQIPHEHFDPSLKESIKDYYQVSDLHNTHELFQAMDYFISRHGPISRIESHSEYWLQTQANLRTHFNIPGMKNDQIENVKRKSAMKSIFKEAGMKPARGRVIHNLDEALQLVGEVGYPLMAKPDIGAGGSGCVKISNETELREFFYSPPNHEYIFEEFIIGDVCTFDGLADEKGQIIFYTSHQYSSGIAEVVNQQLDSYYYSLRNLPEDLELIGRQTVNAFQVKESFFHFEYFRTKKHELIPIEVNMRPPGGFTMDMCNYACDIDLYYQWANVVTGNQNPFAYERKYHVMEVSRRFKHQYKHSHEEILNTWGHLIVSHEGMAPAFARTMGDYCYIARSPSLNQLMDMQKYIDAKQG